MEGNNFLRFLTFCLCYRTAILTKLTDVTSGTFGSHQNGIIAAFGDFDADRMIDIFVWTDSGNKVDIQYARQNGGFYPETLIPSLPIGSENMMIKSVIPTDFNGDAKMDILLCVSSDDSQDDNINLYLYFASTDLNGNTVLDEPLELPWIMNDQPALIDFNGDMHPDLFGELDNGTRIILLGGIYKNLTEMEFPNAPEGSWPALQKPQSCAFVDLNADISPDLLITTTIGYEAWINKNGVLTYNRSYSFPFPGGVDSSDAQQIVVTDIDRDGIQDILLCVCSGDNCIDGSSIYVYHLGSWNLMNKDFIIDGEQWSFVPADENAGDIQFPITLRIGDYNMDGYPDAMTVLRTRELGQWVQKLVLLENAECKIDLCEALGRTFIPDVRTPIWTMENVIVGSFFDLDENGILDVLVVGMTSNQTSRTKYPVVAAYQQTSTTDACFMKVTVTNGLCYENCPDYQKPYGVNQPGPGVGYDTLGVDGNTDKSIATQLSQSSHFALQLPYTLFGLGMTPNFLDTVSVAISQSSDEARQRSWQQIIPNSQLVVVPYPIDSPTRWSLKLFIEPSKTVLLTGTAFLGAMVFIAAIIGGLHWRERVEDKKEKRQESHKFHFDAM